ncbi:hypothetical protein I7I51_02790 [Histoplasma capsulatum]|uniref:Uncharacterized protein n=1 Tax=Ajellomyces capsulatus TaxID=5037 RepID=A0A8A1MKG1_AJECA|nr:hypothetical protein I7I51_02790 [Histoplasma capsulatum]
MTPQGVKPRTVLARDSTVDQPKCRLMMDFFRNTGPTPPGYDERKRIPPKRHFDGLPTGLFPPNPDHVKGVPTKGGDRSSIEKGLVPNRADFAIGTWKVSPFSFRPMQILGSPSVIQTLLEDILTRRCRLTTPAIGLKDGIALADEIHAEVRSRHSNDTAGSPSGREQEQEVKAAIVPELLINNTTAVDLSHQPRVPISDGGSEGVSDSGAKPRRPECGWDLCDRGVSKLSPLQKT